MHPFGHRNIFVRQIFIYSKTKRVIKFDSGQNWPTGVCTPNIVIKQWLFLPGGTKSLATMLCGQYSGYKTFCIIYKYLLEYANMVTIKYNLRIFKG